MARYEVVDLTVCVLAAAWFGLGVAVIVNAVGSGLASIDPRTNPGRLVGTVGFALLAVVGLL